MSAQSKMYDNDAGPRRTEPLTPDYGGGGGALDDPDNKSTSSRSSYEERENVLFMSSTISRDDTSSKTSQQQDLLSQLNRQLNGRGGLQLQNSQVATFLQGQQGGPPPPPPGSGRGFPGGFPGGRPPGMPSHTRPRMRPGMHPGMPPLPRGPMPPPPGMVSGPRFPFKKVTRDAAWRKRRARKRSEGLHDATHNSARENKGNEKDVNRSVKTDNKRTGCPEGTSNGLNWPGSSNTPTASASTSKEPTATGPDSARFAGSLVGHEAEQAAHDAGHERSLPENKSESSLIHRDLVKEPGHADDSPGSEEIDDEGLADALGAVAEKHLHIDLSSDKGPLFLSYLLDKIDLLEHQLGYRNASDYSSSDDGSISGDEASPSLPRSQILHRIYCSNQVHVHNKDVYEGRPIYRKGHGEGEARLVGETKVHNVDFHLDRRPDICFVIFKEYTCQQDRQTSRYFKRAFGQDDRALDFNTASAREERIRIVSPLLQRALMQVAEFPVYYRVDPDEDDEYKEMDAPYLFLFHHRGVLRNLAEQEVYKDVLNPLLSYLDETYEAEYQEADSMFHSGRISGAHIGKLFKPNQQVIVRRSPDNLEAAVLKDQPAMKGDNIVFELWSWQYNGSELTRKSWRHKISEISEECTIGDLEVHPAKHGRPEDIAKLEARGKKFWEMRGQAYLSYTGWNRSHDHYYTGARFMVDMCTHDLMHKGTKKVTVETTEILRTDTWPSRIGRRETLPSKALLLLPSTVYGFSLLEKKWVNLNVDNFHPVDWNKKAFDRLVLDPKTKEMIHALVDVQTTAKKMDDIIAGKGNGLIILLHGSPGTGKTLTAESVAEIAEKPLYRVTCGDIGTEASAVENYLETVLYLGKIWDCGMCAPFSERRCTHTAEVLLLDEADVFLEERTMADLQRNSLVSVFLRILEYYEGILILTSNRVGTFDEAFKSRIQVAIHYDHLTKKSRKQIWQNFFDMIEDSAEEDANMPELERRLDELAAEDMNGRQIRNALLTARQLAKHRQERLDWQHLSQVMKTSAAFNKYLKAVKGHTDEQWAREEQLR
ncbi:hypothetical protein F4780DRAFT_286176 [Xylariomycetidae sp. FL0641]|nr:hypothetical protein F4780DRAFT_286176 [Xylariomycetidae sp. FL0641]